MKIIDRVDINYFRSISSISMGPCSHTNVIAGPNDAGKSNILRALNLFFNNEPEPHYEFDFLRDLNRMREDEARAAKGRMTVWIKIHFNNFIGWKSLPSKFFVKRSWNRYEDRPTDMYPDGVPATTIGRFLNKLRYHYVPAVRSRGIYGDLLADLHDTLLQDESLGLRQSSAALVNDLHRITEAMSVEILNRTKIDSRVDMPGDLQDFFRALDFSTKYNQFDVPLTMRGDGIQSRHIPFILNYIASKSNTYHIWGYEEPENSLEMSKAYEMAEDFRTEFSKDNQIFLTTHSPAFYDIKGPRAARWLVQCFEQDGKVTPTLEPIASTGPVDRTLGLVAVIAPRMRKLREEHAELQSSLKEMSDIAKDAAMPVAFVEGPTDSSILTHAATALGFYRLNCRFESSGGATDLTAFLKLSTRVKPDNRALLGVYDADATGRAEFDKLKASHRVEGTEVRVVDKKKHIYAAILPIPNHLSDATQQFSRLKLVLPLPIEFMFHRDVLTTAEQAGVLRLKSRVSKVGNHELPFEVKVDEVVPLPQEYKYLCKEVDGHCKTEFAEWVVKQDNAVFEPFRLLF